MPEWLQKYTKSLAEKDEQEQVKVEATLSAEARELLNQNKDVPLALRLFKPGNDGNNKALEMLVNSLSQEVGNISQQVSEVEISQVEHKISLEAFELEEKDSPEEQTEEEHHSDENKSSHKSKGKEILQKDDIEDLMQDKEKSANSLPKPKSPLPTFNLGTRAVDVKARPVK